ncbi:MAG: zinc finger CCCH domain-containing protein, partial [Litorivicinaceae bacterium]
IRSSKRSPAIDMSSIKEQDPPALRQEETHPTSSGLGSNMSYDQSTRPLATPAPGVSNLGIASRASAVSGTPDRLNASAERGRAVNERINFEEKNEDSDDALSQDPNPSDEASMMVMLQRQIANLTNMIRQQDHKVETFRNQAAEAVRASASNAHLYHTEQSAESWIVDEHIREDTLPEFVFIDENGKIENLYQHRLRMKIWGRCRETIPEEIIEGLPAGDVREAYNRVISYSQGNAAAQITELVKDERKWLESKSDKSMTQWLNGVREFQHQRKLLRAPLSDVILKQMVFEQLIGDERYKDVMKDSHNHPEWSFTQFCDMLVSAATYADDLVQHEKSGPHAQKRLAKLNKNKERRQRKKALVRQATYNKGFMDNAETNSGVRPRAEGRGITPEQRLAMSKEVCTNNLINACTRGTSCWRRHVSLEDLKAEKANPKGRRNARGNTDRAESTKARKETNGGANPEEICAQWKQNGKCDYGDKCSFEHPTNAKAKRNFMARKD